MSNKETKQNNNLPEFHINEKAPRLYSKCVSGKTELSPVDIAMIKQKGRPAKEATDSGKNKEESK